jgi:hypothetical protein
MNEALEIDYAYQADRLLLLVARRGKLPANSDQLPALDVELISVEDLLRSYRLIRATDTARGEHDRRRLSPAG